jgi:tetratricopeptide (TPR) repeat protein
VRVVYGRVLEMLSHTDSIDDAAARLHHAVSVLEQAIALAPEHPATRDARFSLAVAYAKLGDPRKEIAVYDELLRSETLIEPRGIVLANQAEAYMLLGDLLRSVEGYREALKLAADNVLARWGLAVALDRSGDSDAALGEAQLAIQSDPLGASLSHPSVFFIPDYDRFWYVALGWMARASQRTDRAQAAVAWKRAEDNWIQYIDHAKPDDPWLRSANARRQLCGQRQKSSQRSGR